MWIHVLCLFFILKRTYRALAKWYSSFLFLFFLFCFHFTFFFPFASQFKLVFQQFPSFCALLLNWLRLSRKFIFANTKNDLFRNQHQEKKNMRKWREENKYLVFPVMFSFVHAFFVPCSSLFYHTSV